MKRLFIIGAGGFGREVFSWIQQIPNRDREWAFGGFLDDDLSKCNERTPIIARVKDYEPTKNDVFCCAIGDPETKKSICLPFLNEGCEFINVYHPSLIMGGNIKIGTGVILCPNTVITCDVVIGKFVTINVGCVIGHDVKVGDWTTISPHCDLTGFAELGEGVFLGAGARILPSVKVGDCAKVAAGSVVLKRVKPSETVWGNPAREL